MKNTLQRKSGSGKGSAVSRLFRKAVAKAAGPMRPEKSGQKADTPEAAKTARVVEKKKPLTRLEAFGREMDDLKQRTMAQVGEVDRNYIMRVIQTKNIIAIFGRVLIFGGAVTLHPVALILGTLALCASQIIENMEIGHNVIHGQYDFMDHPKINSKNYEWDPVVPAEQWKHYHNYIHHTYTNVVGRDHDIGYGFIRLSNDVPWKPNNSWQSLMTIWLALDFQHLAALHDSRFFEFINPKSWRPPSTEPRPGWDYFWRKVRQYQKKAWWKFSKEYILIPALAGPFFLPVLICNGVARTMTNLWEFAIIFCGHFTRDSYFFTEEEFKNETRGGWYLRQILGSSNLSGSSLFYFMTGHLSHQVEHHLFPDVPAHRYPEMAEEVQRLCKKYGIPYNNGPFWRQFSSVIWRIIKFSFPNATDTEPRSYFDRKCMDLPVSEDGFENAVITEVRSETADAKTYRIKPDVWKPFAPGSFLTLQLDAAGRPFTSLPAGEDSVYRTYTISSSPDDAGYYEITVKRVKEGLVSNALFKYAKAGMHLRVADPAGAFTWDVTEEKPVTMIAGGSGITPMMSMLRGLTGEGLYAGRRQVDLHYFVRTAEDIIFYNELKELAKRPEINVTVYCERGLLPERSGPARKAVQFGLGRITPAMIERREIHIQNRAVLLCGPGPMMAAVEELVEKSKYSPAVFAKESFVPAAAPTKVAAGSLAGGAVGAQDSTQLPQTEEGTGELRVSFQKSATATDPEGKTLLEAAEDAGLNPEFGCRMGICYTCRCKKVSGRVRNTQTGEVSDVPGEKIRLCVSKAESDTVLEL